MNANPLVWRWKKNPALHTLKRFYTDKITSGEVNKKSLTISFNWFNIMKYCKFFITIDVSSYVKNRIRIINFFGFAFLYICPNMSNFWNVTENQNKEKDSLESELSFFPKCVRHLYFYGITKKNFRLLKRHGKRE